jgi:hypothetical protein
LSRAGNQRTENGLSNARVWRALLGVEIAVIERVEIDDDGEAPVIVVQVRPGRRQRGRCGVYLRRCRDYDQGSGRRRWRHLDAGVLPVYLEGDAPRVACPDHGPTVAAVPWVRHKAGTHPGVRRRGGVAGGRDRQDDTVRCFGSPGARSDRSWPGSPPTR